jgi:hypothetical protein
MKNTDKRTRVIFTLMFTVAEKRRIDKAAINSGWQRGESAIFARQLLLGCAAKCLSSKPALGAVSTKRCASHYQ